MRRTGNEKLRGQRGASLLIALLFTLVGSMVSIVIVTAASTAVKRMYDDTTREQEYLTLESAALLLREELEHTTYKVLVTLRTDEETGKTDYVYEYAPGKGLFAQEIYLAMKDGAKQTFKLPVSALILDPEPDKWELPAQSPFQDVVMEELEITSAADEAPSDKVNLTLTATIHLKDSEAQKLYLTAESSFSPSSEGENSYLFNATLQTR